MVARLSDQIIPYPTGRFRFSHRYQAINCLATFVTTGQRQLTPVHEFDSTSQDSRTSRNPISPARSFSRSGHWFSDRPYLPHHSSSSISLVKDLCDLCDLAVNRFSVQLGPVRQNKLPELFDHFCCRLLPPG